MGVPHPAFVSPGQDAEQLSGFLAQFRSWSCRRKTGRLPTWENTAGRRHTETQRKQGRAAALGCLPPEAGVWTCSHGTAEPRSYRHAFFTHAVRCMMLATISPMTGKSLRRCVGYCEAHLQPVWEAITAVCQHQGPRSAHFGVRSTTSSACSAGPNSRTVDMSSELWVFSFSVFPGQEAHPRSFLIFLNLQQGH